MINSYEDALQYLYQNLPMFQRVGPIAFKKDLTNTIALCKALDDPHKKFRSIHIAGTNGKGSTSHMLASVFQEAGYKTGLYTSPHLKEFTERIRVNGNEVTRDYVVGFVNKVQPLIEDIRPSFFEITVAMAFDYFALSAVDIAVVETGLGGRLDSTNVITPLASLITNISMDHKDLLGDTLELIAGEKAGIMKPGVPAIIGERQPDVEHVFVQRAKAIAAPLYFASNEYRAERKGSQVEVMRSDENVMTVDLPLKGDYQLQNLPGVLKTLDVVNSLLPVPHELRARGLENVIRNTGLKGRWQQINSRPTVVCDTAHNAAGIQEILRQIMRQHFKRLFFVIGFVKDKDVREVLKMFPTDARYYFCQAKIPRAMDAGILMREAQAFGLKGLAVPDVNEAIRAAIRDAAPDDFVFIGGSTFVVAEIENL